MDALTADNGGRYMNPRQPFDSAVQRLLDEQAAAGQASVPSTNTERVRAARASMDRSLKDRTEIAGLPNKVRTHSVEIKEGLAGRIYVPDSPAGKALPFLIYLHGGGWVVGSVDTLDPFCRLLSQTSGVIICSVEYRLAPEYPYPAALEDTLSAIHWAAVHAVDWGGNPSQLALGGDSAGANLAAVAANKVCGDDPTYPLYALLLLYPVTDHPNAGHASYAENGRGYGLEATVMRWFWQQYTPHVSATDPGVAPLRLENIPPLPPTLVATAEYDILRDEGIAYAQKLTGAGVRVTHLHSPDMGHNFPATPSTVGRFPQSLETLDRIADWLREVLP